MRAKERRQRIAHAPLRAGRAMLDEINVRKSQVRFVVKRRQRDRTSLKGSSKVSIVFRHCMSSHNLCRVVQATAPPELLAAIFSFVFVQSIATQTPRSMSCEQGIG